MPAWYFKGGCEVSPETLPVVQYTEGDVTVLLLKLPVILRLSVEETVRHVFHFVNALPRRHPWTAEM